MRIYKICGKYADNFNNISNVINIILIIVSICILIFFGVIIYNMNSNTKFVLDAKKAICEINYNFNGQHPEKCQNIK